MSALLAELAVLLRRRDPIPPNVLADAHAAGLRLTCVAREPRLVARHLDLAWLLPE
jgi:hypothetical protein